MSELCLIEKKCEQRTGSSMCKMRITCQPIVMQCTGCARSENDYCLVYASPSTMWRTAKVCPMATHVKSEAKSEKKINPLKQSKQAMRNKKK